MSAPTHLHRRRLQHRVSLKHLSQQAKSLQPQGETRNFQAKPLGEAMRRKTGRLFREVGMVRSPIGPWLGWRAPARWPRGSTKPA